VEIAYELVPAKAFAIEELTVILLPAQTDAVPEGLTVKTGL